MWGQRCTVLLMHFSFYYLTVAFTTYDFSATSLKNNNNQTSTAIYLLVFSAYWKEMEVTHTNTHTHGAPYEHERSRNLHPRELKLIHLFVGVLLWGILSAHLFCSGAFSVHTCSALGHSQCTLVLSVVRSTASPNTDHVSSTMSAPHSSGAAVLKQICVPGRNG